MRTAFDLVIPPDSLVFKQIDDVCDSADKWISAIRSVRPPLHFLLICLQVHQFEKGSRAARSADAMRARELMPRIIDWPVGADRSNWGFDNATIGQLLMPVEITDRELDPE